MNGLVTHGRELRSNNAIEQPVKLSASARVRRVWYFAPSARLGAQRLAARRES